jgi:V8-like Glu-specific endopeptidase
MEAPVKSLLVGVLGFFLTTTALAQERPAEVSDATKAYLETQILALKHEGPTADALRQAMPVPLFPLNVDSSLRTVKVQATGAGVPRIVADEAEVTALGRTRQPGQPGPELLGDRAPEITEDDEELEGRTIFGPDNRFIFHDHNYPFRTVGRVSNSRGSCSGTLVGPRHLLTASHCIVWNGDGTVGWLKFEASRYDAHHSGVAWATRVYYYRKVTGPFLNGLDIAFDFVAVVLDTRLGDSLGWMGSKTYATSWNGGAFWANIGYPADLGATVKPVFQNGCAITGAFTQCFSGWCSLQLTSLCDIFPGQSGSALYGFWSGAPYTVAVTSAENSVTNLFGGGALLPTLVSRARTENP